MRNGSNSSRPFLLEVPENIAKTDKSKLIDFTGMDMYPSKYRYINGKVKIKSLILEDIRKQQDALIKLNTTVLIGDRILVDFKFGHLVNNEWIDLYVKGIFKVKRIIPTRHHEVIFVITEWV